MDLTAERFTEIVTSLASDPKGESQHDQRRQPRTGLRSRASIIPLGETSRASAISIQVRDLSSAGIGFLHEQKMSLDEQFALVLPRTGDTPAVVLCAVAFWQPMGRDLFAIGARYVRILRDGGDPPLPIKVDLSAVDLAAEMQRLRKAS